MLRDYVCHSYGKLVSTPPAPGAFVDSPAGSTHVLRMHHRARVVKLLRVHGSMHRAEIARRAGVSRTTVSTIVNELLDEGLVVERDGIDRRGASGRPGRLSRLPEVLSVTRPA